MGCKDCIYYREDKDSNFAWCNHAEGTRPVTSRPPEDTEIILEECEHYVSKGDAWASTRWED